MLRFFTPGRLALLALGALALPLVRAGCGKKVTSSDASYTRVEGTPDANARLVSWPDTPTGFIEVADLGGIGPTEEDTLLAEYVVFRTGPGTQRLMVLDGTKASGYQLLRRAQNGGYEKLRDFTVQSSRKWLASQWEVYESFDYAPSGFWPPTYVGRGLVGGVATMQSPLTNTAESEMPMADLQVIDYAGNRAPVDSLFTMEWTPVTGAAGYWIHVYQFSSAATDEEKLLSGSPSPIWNGLVNDFLVAFVPAGTTTYRYGDPGAEILLKRAPLRGQSYLVRIAAVDANGQLVGATLGDIGFRQGDGFYDFYPVGAFTVNPGSHAPALRPVPAGLSRLTVPGLPAWKPRQMVEAGRGRPFNLAGMTARRVR